MGNAILIAGALLVGLGLLISILLVIASKLMQVPSNELAETINELLPGANCGACGYAGCAAYADALANDPDVSEALCIPGGDKTAAALAEVLGREAKDIEEQVAVVRCQGSYDHTGLKYKYDGRHSCYAQAKIFYGSSDCPFGCLAYGDCVEACQFDAIHVVNGVAVVDKLKCNGCGMCAKACPKQLIELLSLRNAAVVKCRNIDKGAITRKICEIGCIGCGLCKKNCPVDCIEIANNLAYIDHDRCIFCKKCITACPTNAIGTTLALRREEAAVQQQ